LGHSRMQCGVRWALLGRPHERRESELGAGQVCKCVMPLLQELSGDSPGQSTLAPCCSPACWRLAHSLLFHPGATQDSWRVQRRWSAGVLWLTVPCCGCHPAARCCSCHPAALRGCVVCMRAMLPAVAAKPRAAEPRFCAVLCCAMLYHAVLCSTVMTLNMDVSVPLSECPNQCNKNGCARVLRMPGASQQAQPCHLSVYMPAV